MGSGDVPMVARDEAMCSRAHRCRTRSPTCRRADAGEVLVCESRPRGRRGATIPNAFAVSHALVIVADRTAEANASHTERGGGDRIAMSERSRCLCRRQPQYGSSSQAHHVLRMHDGARPEVADVEQAFHEHAVAGDASASCASRSPPTGGRLTKNPPGTTGTMTCS